MATDSIAAAYEQDEALNAAGAIDGRYRSRTRAVARYFSEAALIRYRVRAEIEWYLSLAANPAIDAVPALDTVRAECLRALYREFTPADARRVKQLEAETNHDVKALEYFLKERIAALDPSLPLEMIHFACTSEDISNLAWALMLKEFAERELIPAIDRIRGILAANALRYAHIAMVSRTHGQAASPTTVGKEFAVFAWRLERQLTQLRRQEYLGKANGAVGNLNAHHFAYPNADWLDHTRRFVEGLGLVWNPLTTQIESHDFLAELFDTVARINTILLGFARDIWGYVSLGYFTQKLVAGEVGSSVMPHKVNPIDFENAEGNLGLASAMLQHLAIKLPVARWQRDLSDSTAMRGIGNAFGHVIVALSSLERGLGKLEIDPARIAADIEDEKAWEVVAEAIQTVMRRYGCDRPYERLKELTRGRSVNRRAIAEFVATLPLDEAAREDLLQLEPRTYLGLAAELAERFVAPGKPSQK
ncbi:MAG: adenylosuccinate lyase [Candidatus Binataceae bacterium]|jgi:adenylosuccinate lyase